MVVTVLKRQSFIRNVRSRLGMAAMIIATIAIVILIASCGRSQNTATLATTTTIAEPSWMAVAHSPSYSAYTTRDRQVYIKGAGVDLLVGPEKSSPIVGSGLWFDDPNDPPKKGDEFGISLAIHEHDTHNYLIEGGSALVAIGHLAMTQTALTQARSMSTESVQKGCGGSQR